MEVSQITFMLDQELLEIDFSQVNYSPTTTVLNFLRSRSDRKGTKEGCAEGDCGACTVVVAELSDEGNLKYKACDSCLIFLPMLHGRQLLTVESLKQNGHLHPVQKAMVESDGSQCGYCTPGIVMSLYAMFKSGEQDTSTLIDGLTGNLCRCTGYRPILEAAIKSVSATSNDVDKQEQQTIKILRQIDDNRKNLKLSFREQNYIKPKDLDSALVALAENNKAMLVNGATDIGLMVTKQRKVLKNLIDISDIRELKQINVHSNSIEYGAGVSLEDVKNSAEKHFPALYKMLVVFGSRQIRELGTLGGNVANASPIGDTPPVLMALNAQIKLISSKGIRSLPIQEFITGYRQTDLRPGELIYSIVVPRDQDDAIIEGYKISKRKDLDISTVSGGFRLKLNTDDTIQDIKLYYGGMAEMIKNASEAESFLLGKKWERSNVEAAQELVEDEFSPISDARSGANGRSVMAKNLLLKFWDETRAN